jgi:hypothetical protein
MEYIKGNIVILEGAVGDRRISGRSGVYLLSPCNTVLPLNLSPDVRGTEGEGENPGDRQRVFEFSAVTAG